MDKVTLPSSVDTVECLVAIWILQFAIECAFSSIILEDDSKTMYRTLCCEDVSLLFVGHLVYEFKTLADTFCVVTFSRTWRQCNSVVHNLALYAIHVRCLSGWEEDVTSHLLFVTLANFGWVCLNNIVRF